MELQFGSLDETVYDMFYKSHDRTVLATMMSTLSRLVQA